MLVGDILNKLQGVKKLSDNSWMAQCPSHDDKKPSLHVTQVEDKILLKCQAGCQTETVVKAMGLEMADLFTDKKLPPPAEEVKSPKIVKTYDYQDEARITLYQVVRYEPKGFSQRHKNSNGNWVYNLEGIRRVLYHLPEILDETGTIYLVEGEKDADKLWEYGQVATTSPGGASNWKPEYANFLTGKRVVIIPDKDEAGYSYARSVIKSLQNKAKEVKCIILPEGKDFSDWIEAGGDVAELSLLEQDISILFNSEKPNYQEEEDAILWQKNIKGQNLTFKAEFIHQERTGIHARVSIEIDYQSLGWSLINIERSEDRTRLANQAFKELKIEGYTNENLKRDLDLFCIGLWDFKLSVFAPEFMMGDEEQSPPSFYLEPYIIEGGGSILFSPPGRGKSNSALTMAQSINCGISKLWSVKKVPVMYINLERSGQSIRRRLTNINKVLGLPVKQPLLIFNARGKSLADIAPVIRKAVKQYGIRLLILDSISRAGYGDLTENRPVNLIIDTLSGLCETWLALGHTPRANEEHIYGAIMFEAGADIVIQLRSQVTENKLGVGFEIVKSNDLPHFKQRVYAFEFEDWKLTNVRPAKPFEFPDIEAKSKSNMLDDIMDFISNQDSGEASATEIEKELGYNRVNISKILNHSGKFIKTRKEKQAQFFGVKVV